MSLKENQSANQPFLPVVRELARAYQAFSAYSEVHVRQFDLTSTSSS